MRCILNRTRLVISVILMAGCGGSTSTDPGSNPGNGYYIRFRAGSVDRNYTGDLVVHGAFNQVSSEYIFTADGVAEDGSITGGSIILGAQDVSPVTTKTYGSFQVVGSGWTMGVILYSIGGTQYDNDDVPNDIRVTITEISSTAVKGTFSGTVKANGKPSISITNGEFNVRRVN